MGWKLTGGSGCILTLDRLPGKPQVPGQAAIRYEEGGIPALLLPDDKGRSGGGENPAGGARGGWRSEGVVIFGGFSVLQCNHFHFFSL